MMINSPESYSGTIYSLVDQNYRLARVLDSYGVNFFDHFDQTLSGLCSEKGIAIQSIVEQFEKITRVKSPDLSQVNAYPVDTIIKYLKHNHYIYIKEQLPFVRRMIEHLEAQNRADSDLINDLKFIFPIFIEDFIHHIYEEEDSLFSYILKMHQVFEGNGFSGKVYFDMEQHSIQELAMEHQEDDDEMRGIRGIINQYDIDQLENLHLKVIFLELKSFDEELALHARIENEVLFPKALALEKKVKSMYAGKVRFN